jgi:hypothetical protein
MSNPIKYGSNATILDPTMKLRWFTKEVVRGDGTTRMKKVLQHDL